MPQDVLVFLGISLAAGSPTQRPLALEAWPKCATEKVKRFPHGEHKSLLASQIREFPASRARVVRSPPRTRRQLSGAVSWTVRARRHRTPAAPFCAAVSAICPRTPCIPADAMETGDWS